ncbi:lasso peptide biosynthesis PqqD family chaperone [Bacillus pinisoli]|uniref:lasso peptide biosynthesis PqqD family chaperone n=1 Tax=Bacillus pinisoli TaxID=2901866 RepID=UPI001FF2DDA1|nr:lasso peptide biosynthesis PqqD family chaperone [Bacillus pinisoli]
MIKNEIISLETIVLQSEGNIVSDMGGEKVMLSIENGKYYNLGEIGGAIWDLINTPKSISELIDKLVGQYDVEEEECKEQILPFLEHLKTENLIKIVD